MITKCPLCNWQEPIVATEMTLHPYRDGIGLHFISKHNELVNIIIQNWSRFTAYNPLIPSDLNSAIEEAVVSGRLREYQLLQAMQNVAT